MSSNGVGPIFEDPVADLALRLRRSTGSFRRRSRPESPAKKKPPTHSATDHTIADTTGRVDRLAVDDTQREAQKQYIGLSVNRVRATDGLERSVDAKIAGRNGGGKKNGRIWVTSAKCTVSRAATIAAPTLNTNCRTKTSATSQRRLVVRPWGGDDEQHDEHRRCGECLGDCRRERREHRETVARSSD